jgi:large subunit ribosomal protein L2
VAVKILKPTTQSQRGTILIDNSKVVTRKTPEKTLVKDIKKNSGRSKGKISVRHKGGGVKKLYRMVDFKRSVRDIPGKISSIEYDPNRNVFISLVVYENGLKRYNLTPKGVKVGKKVIVSEDAPIEAGSSMPIGKIPAGTEVHNIEVNPGSGGALVRSAGNSATIMGTVGDKVQLRMPSKEIRLINAKSYATIGTLSNTDMKNVRIGKAGRNRRKGVRPTVRGMVMPPNAHPHGGGEGKGQIGHVVQDVYGNVRGVKTRRKKHRYTKNILVSRKGRKITAK